MKILFAQQLNLLPLVISVLLLCTASSATAQNFGGGTGMGMDDMMEGMGMDMQPTPMQTAVESLRQTTNKAKRTKIQTRISGLLSQQYDSYLKQNESELNQMEQRLKNLRNQLERRRSAKELLVELELKRIVNEADGLAWPTNQTRSGFGGGGFTPNSNDFGPPSNSSFGSTAGANQDQFENSDDYESEFGFNKLKGHEQLLQEMIAAQKEWPTTVEKEDHEKKGDAQKPVRIL